MTNLFKLPTWADDEHVFAVIETPRGSTCKLDFDPKLRTFTLAKPLMAGLAYPYDWGFIPSTKAEDGDPLDVLVIHDARTYPGVVMQCRPVGILEVVQKSKGKKERNDRVFAVPERSPLETDLKDSPSSLSCAGRAGAVFSGYRRSRRQGTGISAVAWASTRHQGDRAAGEIAANRHWQVSAPRGGKALFGNELVRQLVLPHFLQAGQAILAIQIFDKCPHDRTPLLVARERLGPLCFRSASRLWKMVSGRYRASGMPACSLRVACSIARRGRDGIFPAKLT